MRLALEDAWVGRGRRSLVCPACGSEQVRPSRRRYEGLWFRVFRLRPVRCAACGLCFPIAIRGAISDPRNRALDVDLPFRPLELEDSVKAASDLASRQRGSGSVRVREGGLGCPACGSGSVHVAQTGTDGDWKWRFEMTHDFRCLECNALFKRISLIRASLLVAVLMSVLGGLSYLAMAFLDPGRTSPMSPTIRKDQIPPPPPPPVFRERFETGTLR